MKAVFDRHPLVGTAPLPDWMHNLVHGLAMLSVDTMRDNLCLWRCVAVYQGANPERSAAKASLLAQSFFCTPVKKHCPKTSLDELDKVETHLNKGKTLDRWLGVRVYEPERIEAGNVV